ncbi:MAG TPA: 2-hydroxyacyl-CoA dehydratase family protein [Myxococcota bacterium]|nr:2-hydroxyacyl-CoA dehydratase family protein [Myxococcota bacterium]
MTGRSLMDLAMDPVSGARERAAARTRRIGLAFAGDFPLELFEAFGLHGACLPAAPKETYPQADALLQAYTCGFVRSCAEAVLSGRLPLALVGTLSGCDAQTNLPGVLMAAGVAVPVLNLRMPIRVGTDAAGRQARAALVDFCRQAERALGSPLDPAALAQATVRHQEVRVRLTALFDGLANGGSAVHAYAAALAARVLDPEAWLAALDAEPATQAPPGGVPILLSGSILPSMQAVVDLVETGCRIVADDTSTGMRSARRRVATDGADPMDALADSLVAPEPHGPERLGDVDRPAAVARRAADAGARAAVLLRQKFCDPQAFEAPALIAALRAVGIPAVVIESDRLPGLSGRDRTLVQTLLEQGTGGAA